MLRLLTVSLALLLSGPLFAQTTAPASMATTQPSPDLNQRIEQCKRSVVKIKLGGSFGAGFLYRSNKYIATAYHVIEREGSITILFLDGKKQGARVVATDEEHDLALLELDEPATELEPLPLALESELVVGAPVFAIGHPYSTSAQQKKKLFGGLLDWTVSQGNISNLSAAAIQTDTPLNPGNSGGPAFVASGHVIGVASRRIPHTDGLGVLVRASLLDAMFSQIGSPLPKKAKRRVGLGALLDLDEGLVGIYGGLLSVDVVQKPRFGLSLQASLATQGPQLLPAGEPFISKTTSRASASASLYSRVLVGQASIPVRLSLGAMVFLDFGNETSLVLQQVDPTCDVAIQECQVEISTVTESFRAPIEVTPTLGVSVENGRNVIGGFIFSDSEFGRIFGRVSFMHRF